MQNSGMLTQSVTILSDRLSLMVVVVCVLGPDCQLFMVLQLFFNVPTITAALYAPPSSPPFTKCCPEKDLCRNFINFTCIGEKHLQNVTACQPNNARGLSSSTLYSL